MCRINPGVPPEPSAAQRCCAGVGFAGWLVASARAAQESPRLRLRLATALGEERIVEAQAANQLADPRIEGIVINSRDITEQVRLEQERDDIQTRDLLTGLMNRTTFVARLDDAVLRAGRGGGPPGGGAPGGGAPGGGGPRSR